MPNKRLRKPKTRLRSLSYLWQLGSGSYVQIQTLVCMHGSHQPENKNKSSSSYEKIYKNSRQSALLICRNYPLIKFDIIPKIQDGCHKTRIKTKKRLVKSNGSLRSGDDGMPNKRLRKPKTRLRSLSYLWQLGSGSYVQIQTLVCMHGSHQPENKNKSSSSYEKIYKNSRQSALLICRNYPLIKFDIIPKIQDGCHKT